VKKQNLKAVHDEIARINKADRAFFLFSNKLDGIMAEHHITRTEYSNHSLVGNHCATFLEEWPLIKPKVEALFKSPERRANAPATLNGDIDEFLASFSNAVEALYVLRLYMYSSTKLTEAEVANFKKLAEYFIDLFRTDPWLKRSITPKMHIMETHAPDQLARLGRCLSQFMEEHIEREHRICKTLDLQYNLMTNWGQREKAMMDRLARSALPSTRQFEADTRSRLKRNLSAESAEKSLAKKALVKQTEQGRKSMAMLKVNQASEV